MFYKAVLMIVFSFAVGLVGCRSCWGPYDYCQPTFVPEAGDECMGALYRNGSILGGMERRGNCSSCEACSGGVSGYNAGYGYTEGYETSYDGAYVEQEGSYSGGEGYSEAGATEPLPNSGAAPTETIPTPAPQSSGKGSIRDYLPDPALGGGI